MKTKKLSAKQEVELAVERAVSQEAGTDAVDSVDAVIVREEEEQTIPRKPKPGKKRKPRKKRKPAKKR
jgi:hypothetical protein